MQTPNTYEDLLQIFDEKMSHIKLAKQESNVEIVNSFKEIAKKFLENNKQDIGKIMDLVFTINMYNF
jgi:hypothetical protein